MPEKPSSLPAPSRRLPVAIGIVVAGALIGAAVFYGMGGLKRGTSGDSTCSGAVDLAKRSRRWPMARWRP